MTRRSGHEPGQELLSDQVINGLDKSSQSEIQADTVMSTSFTLIRNTLLVLLLSMVSLAALAAEPVSKSRLGGVAIGGYDTVAYQTLKREPQQSPVEGNKRYVVEYKGAKWRFASEESAKLFSENPEKFSPAYNGFCANALSTGNGLVKTDGTHWEIFGDQLFLFYAGQGRDRWVEGQWEDYKVDADAAWETLSK